MTLKFDMSKNYDRVEWRFLIVLLKMGFDQRVLSLFMSCISSTRYQISNAGRSFGSIISSRSLRQRDPLSFYLVFTCIEGITVLIHNYEKRKLIKGIKVARSAPSVSHIFFADDLYIFVKLV